MIQIYYVRSPNLYIAINNGEIGAIERNNNKEIDEYAILVEGFDASPDSGVHMRGDRLVLDGLAIFSLFLWLRSEKPDRTAKATFAALERLFEGAHDRVAIQSALRAFVKAASSREKEEHGELAYYVMQQIHLHPEELAELRAEWRRQDTQSESVVNRHDPSKNR